jgi:hypothetical protein
VVLAAVLNEALQSIGSWMRANKLSSPVYTTFIFGTARLNFGTRTHAEKKSALFTLQILAD